MENCIAFNGDLALLLRPFMIVPFIEGKENDAQLFFNCCMSTVRVAGEWNYKDPKQNYPNNEFKRLLKVRPAPIALLSKASASVLTMATCICDGGQIW